MSFLPAPLCPWARVVTGPLAEDTAGYLAVIPGTRYRGGALQVPWHAFDMVNRRLVEAQVTVRAASWVIPPPTPGTWERIEGTLRAAHEIRDFVLEPGYLMPYQQAGVAYAAVRKGALFLHGTGAGKTLSAILWALATPGTVVVVTRAAARIQWGQEIEKFTHLHPFVLRPGGCTPGEIAACRAKHVRAADRLATARTVATATGAALATLPPTTGKRAAKKAATATRKADEAVEAAELAFTRARLRQARAEQTLDRYRVETARPVVVVAWEALAANLDTILALRPVSVVFDESHQGKSWKRWNAVPVAIPVDAEPAVREAAIYEARAEARQRGGFLAEKEGEYTIMEPADNRTTAAATLAQRARRRLCTTATFISDRVRDAWAQLDLCEPGAWGNWTAFSNRYAGAKPGYGGSRDTKGTSNLDELLARMRFVVHAVEYAETHRSLPAKRRVSRYVEQADQDPPSGGFAMELRDAMARGPTALLEARLQESASRKRTATTTLIQDHAASGHKIIVFTGRRADAERLATMVRKACPGVMTWCAHGGMSHDRRAEIQDEFMGNPALGVAAHPGPCVLVATSASMGESLSLHDADALIFTMLPYTPGGLRQAEGRVSRLGQRRPVLVYYVIAEGTVDEHVADLLIVKLPTVEKVSGDTELAQAADALGGTEDQDALSASILAKLRVALAAGDLDGRDDGD